MKGYQACREKDSLSGFCSSKTNAFTQRFLLIVITLLSNIFIYAQEGITPAKTAFLITPQHQAVPITKKYIQPAVKLVTENELDVTEYFNLKYSMKYRDSNQDSWTDDNTHIDENTGAIHDLGPYEYQVTITATPKSGYSTSYQTPDAGTYDLELYDECDYMLETNKKDLQRELVVKHSNLSSDTPARELPIGTIARLLPGITVQYGSYGKGEFSAWKNHFYEKNPHDTRDTESTMFVRGSAVETDEEGMPVSGGYFCYRPSVNGFLYLDAYWREGRKYVIAYRDNENMVHTIDYTSDEPTHREKKMVNLPLHQDCEYYLYMSEEGEYSQADIDNLSNPVMEFLLRNGNMELYGISFQPAWIQSDQDLSPRTTATAFMNEYDDQDNTYEYDAEKKQNILVAREGHFKNEVTTDLPRIIDHAQDGVSISVANHATIVNDGQETIQDIDGHQDQDGFYAQYTVSTEQVVPSLNHITSLSKTATDDIGATPRVVVNAHIISEEDPAETFDASYRLQIAPMNAYFVRNGQNIAPNQVITAIKGITATIGGWNPAKEDIYQYGQIDGWTPGSAITDDYEMIDGFHDITLGVNPPLSERKKVFHEDQAEPYLNPVRGSFLKFTPTRKANLNVYVIQQGAFDGDGEAADGQHTKVHWRPLYAVDESGQGVAMQVNPYTTSKSRTDKGDAESSDSGYDFSELTDNQKTYLLNLWTSKDAGSQKIGSLDEFYTDIQHEQRQGLTGGYLMNFTGTVRYTWPVLPGKTYYLFQPGCKIGFAGFSYDDEQDESLKDNGTYKTLTFETRNNYTPVADNNNEHVNVVIKDKKVAKDTWNTMVLPFSVNGQQVEDVFGVGTQILHLGRMEARTSEDGKTYDYIEFIKHYDQSIVSGRPLLIKPTFVSADGKPTTTLLHNAEKNKDYTEVLTFRDVAITKNKDQLIDETPYDNSEEDIYDLKGIYNTVDEVTGAALRTIPKGSYYLSWGNLLQSNYGAKSGAFNAYITASPASAGARMMVMNFDDEVIDETTTSIDAITERESITPDTDIYNLQGQKVDTNQQKLSPGIYLHHGKKAVIR